MPERKGRTLESVWTAEKKANVHTADLPCYSCVGGSRCGRRRRMLPAVEYASQDNCEQSGLSQRDCWRGIAITLIDQVMSVNAFHEKARRSQGIGFGICWSCFLSPRVSTVATLPSARFDERVDSLGASWVFSFQPVLPPDCRPFVHPSMEVGQAINAAPKLGFGLLGSLPTKFLDYAAAGTGT